MSRRTVLLAVLGVLVALVGNLVVAGLLFNARQGGQWSRGGPVAAAPSTDPGEKPSDGPSGGSGGGTSDDVINYVALGDSYTAGAGITRSTGPARCLRSNHNYPHLLAAAASRIRLTDRSCSGAETAHLTTSQYADVDPQFNALSADTDLVTVSMGGNDFDLFLGMLVTCARLRGSDPGGAPCSKTGGSFSAASLRTSIEQIGQRLETALGEIETLAPEAQVMLVGYPALAPAHGSCPDRLPLADGDFAYVNGLNELLSTTMRRAASRAGADFVDVFAASRGHDICSSDPWVNDDSTDPGRALFYHPFVEEQAAVARLILAKIR